MMRGFLCLGLVGTLDSDEETSGGGSTVRLDLTLGFRVLTTVPSSRVALMSWRAFAILSALDRRRRLS